MRYQMIGLMQCTVVTIHMYIYHQWHFIFNFCTYVCMLIISEQIFTEDKVKGCVWYRTYVIFSRIPAVHHERYSNMNDCLSRILPIEPRGWGLFKAPPPGLHTIAWPQPAKNSLLDTEIEHKETVEWQGNRRRPQKVFVQFKPCLLT
jgi:hypothetical protein